MFNKLIKISFLIYFLANTPCFAQQQNQLKKEQVLNEFNTYLETVHLKQFIRATDFSYQSTIGHTGTLGKINLAAVNVLTLEPDSAFSDPLQFAGAWKKATRLLKEKTNIYWQLFFKLNDCSGLPPKSLVIILKTSKPGIFSSMVFFDGKIRVSESLADIKGSGNITITPDDFPFDGFFQSAPNSPGLPQKLVKRIDLFLRTNGNGKADAMAHVDIKTRNYSYITFIATNLNGKITHKFYDMIKLYLSIAPSADQKTVDIGYNFSARFGSDPYSTASNVNNYEDAVKRYGIQMAKFSEDLKELIQNTTYGTKPKH